MRLLPIVCFVFASSFGMSGPVLAATIGDADGNGVLSVADGVQVLRAATGLASACTLASCDVDASGAVTMTDGVDVARTALGLPSVAASPGGGASPRVALVPVTVHFTFTASAELQGLDVDVAYPLAKGGFAGSADGVVCTSSGDGIFVANDRDDGTMALLQASATALSFPFEITCEFDQAAGETLVAADLGVTVDEVVENGSAGDPSHLQVAIQVGDAPVSPCDDDTMRFRTVAGAVLDFGWTGVSHGSPLPRAAAAALPLACAPGSSSCDVVGASLVGAAAGPPVPLSAAGVSMCALSTYAAAPTGMVDCATGCSEAHVKIGTRFFLVVEAEHPCPPCVGDAVANDGVKGGTCLGGATPGAACDVGGVTDRFDGAGPDYGKTSLDCLPTGQSVGEPELDLDPIGTGTATLVADRDCLSGAFPAGSCHCPGQVQPNSCIPDGVCGASGFCEEGPLDGTCEHAPFRPCVPDTGTRDCDDIFPGSGTCIVSPRPCFGSTITRTGTCGTHDATLAAVFCMSATRAAAINTVSGLPGPAALTLPIAFGGATVPLPTPVASPSPQPTPLPAGCDALPRAGCHQLVRPHEATLTVRDRTRGVDEIAWRWLGGTPTFPFELGNPIFGTTYAFCAYDQNGLVHRMSVGTDVCRRSDSCWRATRQGGFVYTNHFGNADGLTRVELTPGLQGASRVVVKGRNTRLAVPPLPLPIPLTVQLQADNGTCWEAAYEQADVERNDGTRFRAVAKP